MMSGAFAATLSRMRIRKSLFRPQLVAGAIQACNLNLHLGTSLKASMETWKGLGTRDLRLEII